MKSLTVIIPFLNEGIEVENTLRNIRQYSDENVDIILINDASDDNYDYESIARDFHVLYVKNEKRLGVAASRDLGVELAQTLYFLFLDSHMRFYDNHWVSLIIFNLDQNPKVLLCCQTRALNKIEGEVIEDTKRPISYGAYIGFREEYKYLDAEWIWNPDEFEFQEGFTPCVLGAAYACSKAYWQYLRGLSGLISYGSDEVYISLKVWMNGGKCKFLKEVEVGHIYRKEFPYKVETVHTAYNKLLIAQSLLPEFFKKRVFRKLKQDWKETYQLAFELYLKNIDSINKLSEYYKKILTQNFSSIIQLNQKKSLPLLYKTQAEKNHLLRTMAFHLILQSGSVKNLGLLWGKMGFVLFLFHYAKYTGVSHYREYAECLLDDVYVEINLDLPINMGSGYCGIAWGLYYLIRHGLIDGEEDDVLDEIDRKIMERDPVRISDYNFETGLGGIIFYVLDRIYYAEKENKPPPFDEEYRSRLNHKVMELVSSEEFEKLEHADIMLQYFEFVIHKNPLIIPFNIYDIIPLDIPANLRIDELSLGLQNGISGIGLSLLKMDDYEN